MSNNCLMTKLKGTVINENLPVFGEITIHTNPEQIAELISNGRCYFAGSGVTYSGVTYNNDNQHITSLEEYVKVENKYNLTHFTFYGDGPTTKNASELYTSDFKYCNNLSVFEVKYQKLYGDFADLANCPLIKINLAGCSKLVTGENLTTNVVNNWINTIKVIYTSSSDFFFYVELTTLAKALIAAGRMDPSDYVEFSWGGFTIKGASPSFPVSGNTPMGWTTNSFYIKDTNNVVHTYDLDGNPIS